MGVLSFEVLGTPMPKGSARSFVVGERQVDGSVLHARAVTVADNKKPLAHWQTQIANEARQEMRKGGPPKALPDFTGPLTVRAVFEFNRPRSVKRRRHPSVKPDLDKLLRAVLDALTNVCWQDDAQVVHVTCEKRYRPEPGPEGALIIVGDAE